MFWNLTNRRILLTSLISMAIVGIETRAQVVSGGNFTVSQSVVASGGAASSGGTYTVEGSTGQSAVGGFQQNGSFSLYGGFWTPEALSPTAAPLSISGRVRTAEGIALGNVIVRLTNSLGESIIRHSSSLGYYRFDGLEAGGTYILSVTSRRYAFSQPMRVLSAIDNLEDIDFIANQIN